MSGGLTCVGHITGHIQTLLQTRHLSQELQTAGQHIVDSPIPDTEERTLNTRHNTRTGLDAYHSHSTLNNLVDKFRNFKGTMKIDQ